MVDMSEKQRTIHALIPYVPAVGCFLASLFEPGGKIGAVLLVCVGIVLLIAVIVRQQNQQNRCQRDETDALITCMNEKRHDWLNHLQVIMGYLSINRYDRLRPYLKQLMAEIKAESDICHIGYNPLSRYLLTHKMLRKDMLLDVHIVRGLRINNERQGARLLETIQEVERFLHRTCKPLSKEPLKIEITIVPHDHDIMMYVDLPDQPQQNRELMHADWSSLCEKVSSWDGEVFLEREEPAIECAVRIT